MIMNFLKGIKKAIKGDSNEFTEHPDWRDFK